MRLSCFGAIHIIISPPPYPFRADFDDWCEPLSTMLGQMNPEAKQKRDPSKAPKVAQLVGSGANQTRALSNQTRAAGTGTLSSNPKATQKRAPGKTPKVRCGGVVAVDFPPEIVAVL